MTRLKFILPALAFMLFSTDVFANVDDMHVCLYNTSTIEKQKGIKENILSTISIVETGRYNSQDRRSYPWPWTVTSQGTGEYFDSKEEAIARVKKLYAEGVKSIDVGCMQINLYYHGGAFATLDEAFEPRANVSYAADFVKNLYRKHGTWGAAATAYHSHDEEKAYRYEDKLIKVWKQLKRVVAEGGRLYEVREEPRVLTASVKPSPEPEHREAAGAVSGNFTAKQQAVVPVRPAVDGGTFAAGWRAQKLAEYNARRDNLVYRSNMLNIRTGNGAQ